MSLRDQMKLAGLKMSTLAEQMGLEYSHVSTAITMDDRGEEPKRKSVRERQEQIRDYLETLIKVATRPPEEDGDKKRKPEFWDGPEVAAKRYPVPAGCEARFEHGDVQFGQLVSIQLDPGAGDGRFRFFRVVERPGKQPYADLFDAETGALRSVRIPELETKVRTR